MEHIFKPGDTVHTIWGEEVKLYQLFSPHKKVFTLGFISKRYEEQLSVTTNGCFMIGEESEQSPYMQIIYPHPVRVTPIPEFEEGEEIKCLFDSKIYLFICQKSNGIYVIQDNEGNLLTSTDICKITKPEKTIEELKADLIVHQEMLIVLFDAYVNESKQLSLHDVNLLKDKISSLQEQIKQKYENV